MSSLANIVFVALLAAAPPAPLATFESRYGDFTAYTVAGATPKVEVRFHGRRVFLAQAEEVELYRATPGNALEHIIVQLWSPGLNCQHSYALLTVRKDGSVVPSPVFGECHEMESARWLPDGVELQLSPRADGNAEVETWRFRAGKLDHRVVTLAPGTPWASARKTLFAGGWRAAPDPEATDARRPYPKFPEVSCGRGNDAECNARLQRAGEIIRVWVDWNTPELPVTGIHGD